MCAFLWYHKKASRFHIRGGGIPLPCFSQQKVCAISLPSLKTLRSFPQRCSFSPLPISTQSTRASISQTFMLLYIFSKRYLSQPQIHHHKEQKDKKNFEVRTCLFQKKQAIPCDSFFIFSLEGHLELAQAANLKRVKDFYRPRR
ncbi:hypothetical protein D1R32_gp025 [Tunisvirus fontaine2]|uniref:Uncharacterized protein n=1 Tax=Tunisvirus fontaine2 TaxID=1421067 RepID=V9SG61_9VIRU|nr:hypothetical protein D1R32_gp025 [Tunisvirus fontaine2]AHC54742.1 hypothetical protein TNS_ORF24 [Tunisvirus fontaine2]